VRDSGPGLSDDVQRRLFEPFFTTKPWGQSLGLGLSIALGVAHTMRGTLQGGNHAEGGAEFSFRLPLHPP
jgi:two-component system C4-dicarboxylate transport sensor histidine kinase DctB